MDELVQYFIINSELNMSSGKISAQVGHVATIITHDIIVFKKDIYLTWLKWFQNDQKKIILRGKEKDLKKLIDVGFYYIRDNGLTEIPSGSLTVCGLPPMLKSEAQRFVKRLQLL